MVDITVDDIIDEIARRLHGNFGGLERFYAVEVTSKNFREIVKTPKQSVLLIAYDKSKSCPRKSPVDVSAAAVPVDFVLHDTACPEGTLCG